MRPEDYPFQTEPRWYQRRDFMRFATAHEIALLYEQRCGKSKPAIDRCAFGFINGELSAAIVVAMPSNVPDNWVRDSKLPGMEGEFQLHWPRHLPIKKVLWQAGRWHQKSFQQSLDDLLTFPGFSVLAVNGEATITPHFRAWAPKFLRRRQRIAQIFDETTLLSKAPGTARSKVLHAMAHRYSNVVLRIILDGTPAGEGPLDLYSQFELLRKSFFGYPTFFAFKNRFAEWNNEVAQVTTRAGETKMVEYKAQKVDDKGEKVFLHLDEIHRKMAVVSARVTRREAWKDYKEPIFQTVMFDLGKKQRVAYEQLKNDYETELEGLGLVTANHVLTRYLRLQQVTSNFWPPQNVAELCPACNGDGCEVCEGVGAVLGKTPMARISNDNPRLDMLKETVESTDGKLIIWARYRQEITDIVDMLLTIGRNPVRYDGSVKPKDKFIAEQEFQHGSATDIVANPAAIARGKKLSAASCHIVYSNYFALLIRLQMQDRAEDFNKQESTYIKDLIARDTVDEHIVSALRSKRKITDVVMQEKSGSWL
jgi:hypothetical protein